MARLLKFAAVAAPLLLMPGAAMQAPAVAAMQEDCPVACNPDGSCSADCSSTAPIPVPPPPPPPVASIPPAPIGIPDTPPPDQCSTFQYTALPVYPPQCAVTGSYTTPGGTKIYLLTCCG